MKNLITIVSVFAVFSLTAQNFNKGALTLHLNSGIDIYRTTYKERLQINGFDTTKTTNDTTGNKNFVFGASYCVIKRLALGVSFKFNKYFTSNDNAAKIEPTARSQDFMITADYHLVDRKIFDLSGGLAFGGSHLYYNDNIPAPGKSSGTIITGNGPWFQLRMCPQFLIKQRVGLGVSFYKAFVNYTKMTTNDETINQYYITNWKGNGFGLNFALNVLLIKGE